MAWGTKWEMQFASLHGKQFTLSIMVQGYIGSVEQLMGGPKPFTTKEDDDEDIFKAVRKQVGHLRIMTNDATLLGRLMPDNNLDRLVKLEEIQDNDIVTRWVGFLQCQVFDQPWMNGYRLLDFPVNGIVASLDNVQMTAEMKSQSGSICNIIGSALTQLFGDAASASSMIDGVCVVSTMLNNMWLGWKLLYRLFFENETDMSSAVVINESRSISYLDILEKIFTTLGMTLREVGGYLYFADYTSTINNATELTIYATEEFIEGDLVEDVIDTCAAVNVLDAIGLPMGNKPTQSIMTGRNMVRVQIELDDSDNNLLTLPITEQNTDPAITTALFGGDVLTWQPHERSNNQETFNYIEYDYIKGLWQRVGTGSYQNCVDNVNGHVNDFNFIFTGCFGTCWFLQKGGEQHQIVLTNGLMLSLQYGLSPDNLYGKIYSIKGVQPVSSVDGYLNIQMSFFGWLYPPTGFDIVEDVHLFYVTLKVGNYYWNKANSQWVQVQDSQAPYFSMELENGRIKSNKTSSMNVDEDEGYFIPITHDIIGEVTLSILDYVGLNTISHPDIKFCMVVDELEVNALYPQSVTAVNRDTNDYTQIISMRGFAKSETISSNVGTYNNNMFSKSFLFSSVPGSWITTGTYDGGAQYVAIRPEVHLLQRMAAYYAVRRLLLQQKCDMRPDGESTDLQDEANIGCLLYQYNDKLFCAIDAEHDWRNDTQRIQFIEVKDVQQSSS